MLSVLLHVAVGTSQSFADGCVLIHGSDVPTELATACLGSRTLEDAKKSMGESGSVRLVGNILLFEYGDPGRTLRDEAAAKLMKAIAEKSGSGKSLKLRDISDDPKAFLDALGLGAPLKQFDSYDNWGDIQFRTDPAAVVNLKYDGKIVRVPVQVSEPQKSSEAFANSKPSASPTPGREPARRTEFYFREIRIRYSGFGSSSKKLAAGAHAISELGAKAAQAQADFEKSYKDYLDANNIKLSSSGGFGTLPPGVQDRIRAYARSSPQFRNLDGDQLERALAGATISSIDPLINLSFNFDWKAGDGPNGITISIGM